MYNLINSHPDIFVYGFAILASLLSIVLLCGYGEGMFMWPEKSKRTKEEKKFFCRISGIAIGTVTALFWLMIYFADAIPTWFVFLFIYCVMGAMVVVGVAKDTVGYHKKEG